MLVSVKDAFNHTITILQIVLVRWVGRQILLLLWKLPAKGPVRPCVLDSTFACCKYSHICWDHTQLADPVIMRFVFTSTMNHKSLILFTNWKVSIPLSRRTSLTHYNHWPEQPSTQPEVKCAFTVSIRDSLLASSFSLADSICQVLVTSSRSIFSFSFRLNKNSAMSIWLAFLNVVQCSFWYTFLKWILLNPGWSKCFPSVDFLFVAILQLTF